ncbi:MAG TPA: ankyrin repeat domain-containing protein [Chlamydiales bacterium]|nr:ankyrin repeat domain-containing protein [Chlamydiales bacterium]
MFAVSLKIVRQTIRESRIQIFSSITDRIFKIWNSRYDSYSSHQRRIYDHKAANFILAVLTMPDGNSIINKKNHDGETILHGSVRNDENGSHYIRCLKLLEHGADPNLTDRKGNTPLDIAVAQRNKKLIELLKSYGALSTKK